MGTVACLSVFLKSTAGDQWGELKKRKQLMQGKVHSRHFSLNPPLLIPTQQNSHASAHTCVDVVTLPACDC